jgi:hypothetical protein
MTAIKSRVTAGDGSALFFLCRAHVEKYTDDPSPPVTSDAMRGTGAHGFKSTTDPLARLLSACMQASGRKPLIRLGMPASMEKSTYRLCCRDASQMQVA